MGRVQATKIIFRRAEGSISECYPETFTGPECWSELERHVRRAAYTAPKGGAYDKCDVFVTFADGYEYSTRYDMHHPEYARTDVSEHVRREWLFYARRWCPGHMTHERHQAFLDACGVDVITWQHRCDNYDVPGLAPPNARTIQWVPVLRGGAS